MSLSDTGGTEIISYNVQWDAGTDTFTSLAGFSSNFIDDVYFATASVEPGQTYRIKIRARNYWGWGDFSETITMKASTMPGQVQTPVTSIEATTGGIRVTWVEPDSNSDTITAYKIEAQLPTNDWSEICDGTQEEVV